jgi:hypothetical protein
MMNGKIILAILLLATVYFSGCISFGNAADGTAFDSIARVSYGGWIWKTWRVELTNDHPISNGDGGTIAQRYGILSDENLLQKARDCAASGKKVKLFYHSNFFVGGWEYSDAEVIYKIEGECA